MVMKKRAQAAMEFLMTYGWAILVVLVVIGALAYFGVLNPQNLLPEKCTFPMGLYCKDYIIKSDTNETIFKFQNGMGRGITITSINITSTTDASISCQNDTLSETIPNGESAVVTIPCVVDPSSSKVKLDVDLVYCDSDLSAGDCTTFSHTMRGELLTKIE